jgi:hypothetical protein
LIGVILFVVRSSVELEVAAGSLPFTADLQLFPMSVRMNQY